MLRCFGSWARPASITTPAGAHNGEGRGTEPHLGTGGFGSTNSVLMSAFEDEAPLEELIEKITAVNAGVKRPDDRIRLFQLPLERVV